MIEQLSNAITFYAHYTESKVGKTGLTVTVDVYEGTTGTPIVNDGSATELAGGLYYYTLASGSVDAVGAYIAIFTTATTSVDQRDIPAIWTVGTAGIENLDGTITSRATQTSVDDIPTNAELAAATIANVTTVGSVTNPVTLTARTVEATIDEIEALRLILAAIAGKASGGGGLTITFRDIADTKDRIVATVDADGNRTAVVLDAS